MNITKKQMAVVFVLFFITVLAIYCMPKKKDFTIIIASKSPQKIAAVQEAFQQQFKDKNLHFFAHVTPSGIPAQPIGTSTALEGARNRINGLPQEVRDSADYIVTVENYIAQEPNTLQWYDKGLILMHKKGAAQEYIFETEPVFFDTTYFEEAKKDSKEVTAQGLSTTVGQIIAKKFPTQRMVNHQDFHREPEFGGICRKDLIKAALINAMQNDAVCSKPSDK